MDCIEFKMSGKKWKLPRAVKVEGKSKRWFYEIIGYRKPKKGEYFLSGSEVEAYKSYGDLSMEYIVIKLTERAVQKTIWVPAD